MLCMLQLVAVIKEGDLSPCHVLPLGFVQVLCIDSLFKAPMHGPIQRIRRSTHCALHSVPPTHSPADSSIESPLHLLPCLNPKRSSPGLDARGLQCVSGSLLRSYATLPLRGYRCASAPTSLASLLLPNPVLASSRGSQSSLSQINGSGGCRTVLKNILTRFLLLLWLAPWGL